MLIYIVGFTMGGEQKISFEEANAWARDQGCTFFEIDLETGRNVQKIISWLAQEMR